MQRRGEYSLVNGAQAFEAAVDEARIGIVAGARFEHARAHHRRKRQRDEAGDDDRPGQRQRELDEQAPGAPGGEGHQPERWVAQPTLRSGEPARHTLALQLELNAPLPVQAMGSPSHQLAFDGVGSRTVRAELAAAAEHADRDFVLEYRLAGREIASGVLVHEGSDENFFLAMIEPPARVPSAAIVPREYVFVLDVSGSMHGFPIETAKTLLRGLVANLRPTDTFNIIPFAGGLSKFAPRSVPATRGNLEAAVRFINAQRGSGSTELLAALRGALAMPVRERGVNVRRSRSKIQPRPLIARSTKASSSPGVRGNR